MCYYITLTVGAGADLAGMRECGGRYGLACEAVANRHLAGQLKAGEGYLKATKDSCDCGTVFGSLTGPKRGGHNEEAGLEKKCKEFRRKGWSEAKIGRWLEERKTVARKRGVEEKWAREDARDYIRRWKSFIEEAVGGCTPYVAILLHWYDGTLEGERIAVKRRERKSVRQMNDDDFLKMEEDVLYEFGI